jgi:hypothetical protein
MLGYSYGKSLAWNSLSQTFSHLNTPTHLKPSHSYTYLPMKMEQTECSETVAYKIQTPGNYPEENIQLKSHIRPVPNSTVSKI